MARTSIVSASKKKSGEPIEPEFATNDLFAEILAAITIGEGGLTTREMCIKLNMPPTKRNMTKVEYQIKELIETGLAERCPQRKLSMGIDGVARPVSAWRLIKAE